MSSGLGIISLNEIEDNLDNDFFHGQKVGTTTYFEDSIDTCWKWRQGEFNLWTGYMGEGKTELYKQLALIKALKEGKKFAFFSPENMPANEFFMELAFPLMGRNPYKHSEWKCMSDGDFKTAKEFLNNHFFAVNPKGRKLEDIETAFKYLKEKHDIYGALIDPFLKVSHERDADASYIADFMGRCSDFSKELDISYSLIAHQLTPEIDKKTENYTKPDPYRIKGGGNFADGADNVMIVWRPQKRTSKSDTTVHFESSKIKRHELVSQPNDCTLNFDFKTKWYSFNKINPIQTFWNKGIESKKVTKEDIDIAYNKIEGNGVIDFELAYQHPDPEATVKDAPF